MELRVYCAVCKAYTRAECTCPSSPSSRGSSRSSSLDRFFTLFTVGLIVLGSLNSLAADFAGNWRKVATIWGAVCGIGITIWMSPLAYLVCTKGRKGFSEWWAPLRRRLPHVLFVGLLVTLVVAAIAVPFIIALTFFP